MPDDEIEALATEIDTPNGQDGKEGRNLQNREDGAADQEDAADEGDEEGSEGPDEVVDEPARRPSRRDARIQNLSAAQKRAEEDFKRERERADRIERQLEEIRRSTQQQAQESPEQENARMALMSPDERSDYRLRKAEQRFEAMNRQTAFVATETADKAAFDAKAQIDSLYAKYVPKVEEELTKLRAAGQNVPRQLLFELFVGRDALAGRNKAKGQRERAAGNIRRETTAPLNGKGDQAASRRKSGDTPRARLTGVNI